MHAIKCLKEGNIILLQTDTLWGLSCDAANDNAVKKLYALKKRNVGKPTIILVSDLQMLSKYCICPENIEQFTGISLILPAKPPRKKSKLSAMLIKNGSICARIPDSPFLIHLIRKFGRQIISTSANISGKPPPKSFTEIPLCIKKFVCTIVHNPDMVNIKHAQPSTIIDLTIKTNRPIAKRKGKKYKKIKKLN